MCCIFKAREVSKKTHGVAKHEDTRKFSGTVSSPSPTEVAWSQHPKKQQYVMFNIDSMKGEKEVNGSSLASSAKRKEEQLVQVVVVVVNLVVIIGR